MPARSPTQFPDLTPPPGWTGVSHPPQVRLLPPGTTLDTAKATIIVSPVAARLPAFPPPRALVEAAIAAEAGHSLDILEKRGPEPAPSDWALEGIAYQVRARERDGGSEQRRIYAVYYDDRFLYGVSYLGFGAAYDEHLPAFWATARSIRPFAGQVVPSGSSPAPVD